MRALLGGMALAVGAAACGPIPAASGPSHAAKPVSVGWPQFGNTLENTRFAALTQVSTADVRKLRVAWTMSEGPGASLWEDYPVVVGGTMYLTTGTDEVEALDAATGRVRWSYTPTVDFFLPGAGALVLATNRGVAVSGGRVFVTTFDDRLVALRASTGRLLWQAQVSDPRLGYTETAAPTAFHGSVYVGNSSQGTGVRGFVAAYDARSGVLRWRFYTVPAPGHGWVPRGGHHGGGDVWMPPTLDPTTGVVYAATGNPTPDLVGSVRPGCDPHVDSTIALSASTGRLLWAHHEVCPDVWDYDTDQSPMVFGLDLHGRLTEVVGDASKSGRFSLLAAATGRLLAESPYLTPYSRPHRAPSQRGVSVCPGAFGGLEYSPPSYDPATGRIYLDGSRACMRYVAESPTAAARHRAGQPDVGGAFTLLPAPRPIGYLAAVDARTGRVRWEDRLPLPSVGGTLATAGGLVFTGDDDGHLYAVDARSGRVLWSPDVGLPVGSGPFSYEVGGRQYVAVVTGGSQLAVLAGQRTGGRLVVFALPASHRTRTASG